MIAIAAELEDVPLRNAHVLQQTPHRVRLSLRFLASQPFGKALHRFLKPQMRVSTLQEIEKMLAQRLVMIVFLHEFPPSARFG